jgi:hypothetical protein
MNRMRELEPAHLEFDDPLRHPVSPAAENAG